MKRAVLSEYMSLLGSLNSGYNLMLEWNIDIEVNRYPKFMIFQVYLCRNANSNMTAVVIFPSLNQDWQI
jgi:hypothetical protein